jgi:hypothetical protein
MRSFAQEAQAAVVHQLCGESRRNRLRWGEARKAKRKTSSGVMAAAQRASTPLNHALPDDLPDGGNASEYEGEVCAGRAMAQRHARHVRACPRPDYAEAHTHTHTRTLYAPSCMPAASWRCHSTALCIAHRHCLHSRTHLCGQIERSTSSRRLCQFLLGVLGGSIVIVLLVVERIWPDSLDAVRNLLSCLRAGSGQAPMHCDVVSSRPDSGYLDH